MKPEKEVNRLLKNRESEQAEWIQRKEPLEEVEILKAENLHLKMEILRQKQAELDAELKKLETDVLARLQITEKVRSRFDLSTREIEIRKEPSNGKPDDSTD